MVWFPPRPRSSGFRLLAMPLLSRVDIRDAEMQTYFRDIFALRSGNEGPILANQPGSSFVRKPVTLLPVLDFTDRCYLAQ
jgi:hypothetical protein